MPSKFALQTTNPTNPKQTIHCCAPSLFHTNDSMDRLRDDRHQQDLQKAELKVRATQAVIASLHFDTPPPPANIVFPYQAPFPLLVLPRTPPPLPFFPLQNALLEVERERDLLQEELRQARVAHTKLQADLKAQQAEVSPCKLFHAAQLSPPLVCMYTHTHARTHTYTHARTHTHTHARAHTPALFHLLPVGLLKTKRVRQNAEALIKQHNHERKRLERKYDNLRETLQKVWYTFWFGPCAVLNGACCCCARRHTVCCEIAFVCHSCPDGLCVGVGDCNVVQKISQHDTRSVSIHCLNETNRSENPGL